MSTPVAVEATLGEVAFKVLAAAAIGVALFTWGHHVGYTGEKAAYDLYVSQQKAATEAQVASNQAALKVQQAKYDSQIAFITQEHSNEITQIASQRDAALADSDHSAQQLRDFLAKPRPVRTVVVSGSGPSAAGANGASGDQSLDGVSYLNQWLIDQFSQFDATAATLNEAEAVIAKDRETCNGALPGVTTK